MSAEQYPFAFRYPAGLDALVVRQIIIGSRPTTYGRADGQTSALTSPQQTGACLCRGHGTTARRKSDRVGHVGMSTNNEFIPWPWRHLFTCSSFLLHPFGQWYTGNAHLPSGRQPMSGGQATQAWCLPGLASPRLSAKSDRVPADGDLACSPGRPVFP